MAIGIPGTVALLWDAHQQHGQLPWAEALNPAIRLASNGFKPSPRFLRSLALAQRFGVDHSPAFQALYLPGGQPPPADQRFRNPALARTLSNLAREGGRAFTGGRWRSGSCTASMSYKAARQISGAGAPQTRATTRWCVAPRSAARCSSIGSARCRHRAVAVWVCCRPSHC